MSNSLMNRKNNNRHASVGYGLRRDFNDLVNTMFNGWLDPSFRDEEVMLKTLEPKIEVSENDKAVTVRAEMPGMSEKDIDLEISNDGYLTISGEKKSERKEDQSGNCFSEFTYGSFQRTIPLPWELKSNDATAQFENGILEVSIPKSTEEQGRKKKISITRK